MDDRLHIHRRRLPHWELKGSTYFLTFRVARGELTMPQRLIVLQHIRSGDGKFYDLLAAVLMPDHGHAILTPRDNVELSRIMKGIKGVSAKLVNDSRGTRGQLWQDESFDRIIRDQAELDEKLNYVITNPVRAELVVDPWAYEALYINPNAG
ncbi:MAG TPA: transposase [Tepidisphaeraceae bacterium]|nr:transposase [Tepidisphaeraceae bacterium]